MDDSSKALQSRFYKATEKEELKQRQEKNCSRVGGVCEWQDDSFVFYMIPDLFL